MPSQHHSVLLEMFRDRPALAADLLDGPLDGGLPEYDEASITSAEFNVVEPAEYRADAVVKLKRAGAPVLAVVVEVQLRADAEKLKTWPAYVANLRQRLDCPVTLLVICPTQNVVNWARQPIALGPPASVVTPVAMGPNQTPVITDLDFARKHPELTVLSTISHADERSPEQVFEALFSALGAIPLNRARLYHDFVLTVLSTGPRKLLEELMMTADYQWTSDWALRLLAEGEAKGKVENQAESVLAVLDTKGVAVSDRARSVITNCTDLAQLNEWLRRAVTAERIEDLGGALSA